MTEVLVSGLAFGEGPRWHEGRLFLSDMHAHQVLAISDNGDTELIATIDQQPSGLGWLPDGDLLVVSMLDRKILRVAGNEVTVHADLAHLASSHCNDMVVDRAGRAYVGNFGFDLFTRAERKPAELIRVDADGTAIVVATDLQFPNGAVITPDGSTLIVAETMAARLTAFDIDPSGALTNRRLWAQLDKAVPDGICLDAQSAIWVASPSSNEALRVREGGEVTDRVPTESGAYACMLGGIDGKRLFILTSGSSEPDVCRTKRSAQVEYVDVAVAHAGQP
jgi:sugar lactone lactonase YvrE